MSEAGTQSQPRTLRGRLILWSAMIVATVQTTVFAVVLLYQWQSLRKSFDDRLAAAARIIEETPSIEQTIISREFKELIDEAPWAEPDRPASRVVLLGPDGLMIASSPEAFGPSLQIPVEAAITDAQLSGGWFRTQWTNAAGDVRSVRCFDHWLEDGRRLIIGADSSRIQRSLWFSVRVFLITLPLTVLILSVAATYLASMILAPLRSVRDLATSLQPDQIPEEVDLPPVAHEVVELSRELEAAMHRIDRGYAAQSRFLANVAHELKTPISVILAQGQTLPDLGDCPEDVRDFVASAVDEMRRLGRLIESFLLLTRVREGKAMPNARRYPITEIVVDSVTNCQPTADQYGVSILPRLVESDEEILVQADADLLRTAIDNLIRNAIRFSPRESAVRVECFLSPERVQVAVQDVGPGIPPDMLDSIFDRFAQAPSERRMGRGSGLGLEIAEGIAELHGGSISVSNTDPGCRFILSVPRLT